MLPLGNFLETFNVIVIYVDWGQILKNWEICYRVNIIAGVLYLFYSLSVNVSSSVAADQFLHLIFCKSYLSQN